MIFKVLVHQYTRIHKYKHDIYIYIFACAHMGIDAKSVLLWAAAALRFRDGLRISNVIGADIWYFQMIRKDLFFEGMLVMSSLAQNKCKLRGGFGDSGFTIIFLHFIHYHNIFI